MKRAPASLPKPWKTFKRGISLFLLSSLACAACQPPPGEDPSENPSVDAGLADAQLGSTAVATNDVELVQQAYISSAEWGQLVGFGTKWAGVYSNVAGGVATTQKLLEMLGIIPSTNPSAMYQQLREDIERVEKAISWQISAQARQDRIDDAVSALTTVEAVVKVGRTLEIDADTNTKSNKATLSSTVKLAGLRTLGMNRPRLLKDSDLDNGTHIWDWRLPVPTMVMMIGLRLQIMAAVLPNFRTNGAFKGELELLRNNLIENYDRMVDGVRCQWSDVLSLPQSAVFTGTYGCEDIHGGPDAKTWNTVSYRSSDRDQLQANMAAWNENLRLDILHKMPLFELRQMIDTLGFYIANKPDLTHELKIVNQYPGQADKCLDVQWGVRDSGTPVWLWPCTGNFAQRWKYNRETGEIRNPLIGRCLDVRNGLLTEAQVIIADCNGTDAQKWTYDPITGRVQNALNTLLFAARRPYSIFGFQIDEGNVVRTSASSRAHGSITWASSDSATPES